MFVDENAMLEMNTSILLLRVVSGVISGFVLIAVWFRYLSLKECPTCGLKVNKRFIFCDGCGHDFASARKGL